VPFKNKCIIIIVIIIIIIIVLVPEFMSSNPAEAVGFFGQKNPQHAFLRRRSKAVGSHVVNLRHVKEPKSDVEAAIFGKILCHLPLLGLACGGSWNVLITGPPSWEFDVKLAKALCKNLPAENTQRQLSRPKPTGVVVPTEIIIIII
jgi:hypothetical protein